MALIEEEKWYLRRMMYETVHNLIGPGTVFADNTSPDYERYKALVSLATPEIQKERDWWDPDDLWVPPTVPFPWESTEALLARARDVGTVTPSSFLGDIRRYSVF
jgi:hypothetical protein